jgi:hypothetical protein
VSPWRMIRWMHDCHKIEENGWHGEWEARSIFFSGTRSDRAIPRLLVPQSRLAWRSWEGYVQARALAEGWGCR